MKKVIIKSIIGIGTIILIMFCQCKHKDSSATSIDVNGNQVIVCNISEITDSTYFPLSKIIDKCEFIQLETNDSSLFERVYHVGISDNYIAIHSYGRHPIKLFNRQGKFIRNIGTIGRGPGEFTSLYGIQIDEPNNRIYLTPFAGAEYIISYDMDGILKQNIPLIFKQTKCKVYIENDIVTVLSMPFDNTIPVAYQQTINGKLIQKLPLIDHLILKPDFSSEISSSKNANSYDIQILPWGKENYDTLYYYDTSVNKLVPKYVATFSEEKSGSWTFELSQHYWTWLFGENYNNKKVIIDKMTLEANYFRLINDFYGGIEIKNFFMSNNGVFIGALSSIELQKEINKIKLADDVNTNIKEKLILIEKTVNENSNDVLFVGKMK